uniref:Glycosyl hydrolase family 13 catalytic domain-containing protein n=1 Tax=Ananas comosus var. bracteatus TaxID=296719 RepID=A0A6V7P2C3_ANACO|nr:unnamed protein product [Ananas comosus var. bracteatus]
MVLAQSQFSKFFRWERNMPHTPAAKNYRAHKSWDSGIHFHISRAIIGREAYGVLGLSGSCLPQMAGMIPLLGNKFDWEGDLPLRYPQKDLVIYEMHVRGFTNHDSSKTDCPGTYAGAIEKLDHLTVLLDVVFNHTAEGNENGPILSFRGIDSNTYYMLAPKGEFYNYSGCGNTFNCNHPVVRQFIVDCLRYWVIEMHVDGFRFDLASIMTRSSSLWDPINVYGNSIDLITTGSPLGNPPLIDMISNDPVLNGVKLIAEAWDAGGLYQVGSFPHWGIWSEWNGQEGGRKPWHSINFVCAHDGFTLADLVTYNNKYNLSNGEDNRDGENHNLSWNCGEGVPMIYMGDEYGHTKGGNNNTYCHDNYINYFRWDKKEEAASDFYRFCRLMTNFRRECESLGLDNFPTAERLQWHGHQPRMPDWSETSRFIAFSMTDKVKGEIYVAFNANHQPVIVALPERPGYRWDPLVDTSKAAPYDFLSHDLPDRASAIQQYAHFLNSNLYPMLSYSSVILILRPDV